MADFKRKVYAYITHRGRLLVFVHPFSPEAGIQVPGGTLEPGETPEAGVLREAREETGRDDLELVRFLGTATRDMNDVGRDEIQERYFFHLHCAGEPPDTWRHGEFTPSDGGQAPIPFDFYWAPLPDRVPEMVVDMDQLLPTLLAQSNLFESEPHGRFPVTEVRRGNPSPVGASSDTDQPAGRCGPSRE